MSILKNIIEASKFEGDVFNKNVKLRGRILSPTEAENAGVMQFMIASQLVNQNEDLQRLKNIQAKAEEAQDDIAAMIELSRQMGFRPEYLQQVNEQHDKIICQVISEVSLDKGANWENIKIVMLEKMQNADKNFLWVGMLSKEDRELIINKALDGAEEGRKKINKFFRKRTK